jgi:putative flippase GtrA
MKLPSWLWFLAVGSTAAAVHFAVVLVLVGGGIVQAPLVANVLAWCVAFGVSYGGHRFLTFSHQQAPLARSALRFAAVSLGGLALNEGAYAVLLQFTPLRYDVALFLVLLGVAVVTYWLGRHWAFAGSSQGR